MDEPMLTVRQVAERLSVTPMTVHRWMQTGKLKGYRVGTRWRISPVDLRRVLMDSRSDRQQSEPSALTLVDVGE